MRTLYAVIYEGGYFWHFTNEVFSMQMQPDLNYLTPYLSAAVSIASKAVQLNRPNVRIVEYGLTEVNRREVEIKLKEVPK